MNPQSHSSVLYPLKEKDMEKYVKNTNAKTDCQKYI